MGKEDGAALKLVDPLAMPSQLVLFQEGQILRHARRVVIMQAGVHCEKLPVLICRTEAKETCLLRARDRVQSPNKIVKSNPAAIHIVISGQGVDIYQPVAS